MRRNGEGSLPFKTYRLSQKPKLAPHFDRLAQEGWPVFLRQRDELGVGASWPLLFSTFAEFQFALCTEAGGVAAIGHTLPFVWDGTPEGLPDSLADLLERGIDNRKRRRPPTTLSALAAIVSPRYRTQGLSAAVLRAMRALARAHGLSALVAPVRPTLKASYPLTPMERYVEWKRPDGSPFDPWLRVHWRLGAEFVRIAPWTLSPSGRRGPECGSRRAGPTSCRGRCSPS